MLAGGKQSLSIICCVTGLVCVVGNKHCYCYKTHHPLLAGVLANCVSLERIEINIKDGGYHFSGMEGVVAPLLVFGSMPNLEHLLLQSWPEDPVATSAEVAALSASSNLTYLSLGYSEYCLLAPAECDTWFPAGRHCPLLQHLDMGVWVLGNSAAVQRMVSACPGLQELELRDPDCDLEDSDLNAMGLESANVAASLQALTNLTSLTHLRVDAYDLPEGSCISPAVVKAWSHWTNLQQLELEFRCRKLEDVLVLTQLRSLHNLDISGYNGGECDRLKLMVGHTLHVCAPFCIFVPGIPPSGALMRHV